MILRFFEKKLSKKVLRFFEKKLSKKLPEIKD